MPRHARLSRSDRPTAERPGRGIAPRTGRGTRFRGLELRRRPAADRAGSSEWDSRATRPVFTDVWDLRAKVCSGLGRWGVPFALWGEGTGLRPASRADIGGSAPARPDSDSSMQRNNPGRSPGRVVAVSRTIRRGHRLGSVPDRPACEGRGGASFQSPTLGFGRQPARFR